MINNSKALDKLFYKMPVEKLKDNKLHYIDLHIIDGCNHNCARCVKYAPLSPLNEVPTERITKDITQLAKITNNTLDGISILGGEPLLHTDIIYIMKLCRAMFPNTAITIVTNGLAIPKMPKEFFETLIQYDIWIAISQFYKDEFYSNIVHTLRINNCYDRFVFNKIKEFGCVMFVQMDLDEKGEQDKTKMFNKCPNKNGYITLKDGRLWSCPTSCMKYILNNYFGTNFKTYLDDGIDIYTHTEEEIVNLLKNPKEACKYCTDNGLNRLYFPEQSKKNKNEWIK